MNISAEKIEQDIELYKSWLFEQIQAVIMLEGGAGKFRKKYNIQPQTIGKILNNDNQIKIETLLNCYFKCFTNNTDNRYSVT